MLALGLGHGLREAELARVLADMRGGDGGGDRPLGFPDLRRWWLWGGGLMRREAAAAAKAAAAGGEAARRREKAARRRARAAAAQLARMPTLAPVRSHPSSGAPSAVSGFCAVLSTLYFQRCTFSRASERNGRGSCRRRRWSGSAGSPPRRASCPGTRSTAAARRRCVWCRGGARRRAAGATACGGARPFASGRVFFSPW